MTCNLTDHLSPLELKRLHNFAKVNAVLGVSGGRVLV